MLLAEVSAYAARLGHGSFRPSARPAAGQAARAWWAYAGRAVMQQAARQRLTWGQAVSFVRMRERYIPLYLRYLRGRGATAGAAAAKPDPAVAAMDAQLPEKTVLMFRRLAYAEVTPCCCMHPSFMRLPA